MVPTSLQLDTLDRLHCGHQGMTKCRSLVRTCVWWPGLSKQLEDLVSKCITCQKVLPEHVEPLLPSSFPKRPWERLGMDLFYFNRDTYLLVFDFYSRWIEIRKLSDTTSAGTIEALSSMFATHGLPDTVISDNGPQLASQMFSDFARAYEFTHVTSSPHYPQANGGAERAVQTIKALSKEEC